MSVSEVVRAVDGKPRFRRRRLWIGATAAVTVVALLAWLVEGFEVIPRVEFAVSGSMAATAVAHGENEGHPWELDVFYQDGNLCMFLDPPGVGTEGTYGGSCWTPGQDQSSGDFTPFNELDGKASNLTMIFGALPNGAAAMRILDHVVVTGRPMPHPHGNYPTQFYLWIAPDGPTAATGAILNTPVPLDAAGHAMPTPAASACPDCPAPVIEPS